MVERLPVLLPERSGFDPCAFGGFREEALS